MLRDTRTQIIIANLQDELLTNLTYFLSKDSNRVFPYYERGTPACRLLQGQVKKTYDLTCRELRGAIRFMDIARERDVTSLSTLCIEDAIRAGVLFDNDGTAGALRVSGSHTALLDLRHTINKISLYTTRTPVGLCLPLWGPKPDHVVVDVPGLELSVVCKLVGLHRQAVRLMCTVYSATQGSTKDVIALDSPTERSLQRDRVSLREAEKWVRQRL